MSAVDNLLQALVEVQKELEQKTNTVMGEMEMELLSSSPNYGQSKKDAMFFYSHLIVDLERSEKVAQEVLNGIMKLNRLNPMFLNYGDMLENVKDYQKW